jgi:uncharacterized protein (TIGR02217 family)
MRSLDDVALLIAFFEARQGQLYGFRWKDWSDYKSGAPSVDPNFEDQVIAIGDGVRAIWPLSKTYSSGGASYVRPIAKPVAGSVSIGIQGDLQQESIHFQVDSQTGMITFDHPPDEGVEVTAGYEFDVPVRFDTDRVQTSVASFQAGDAPNVPVVEVRV